MEFGVNLARINGARRANPRGNSSALKPQDANKTEPLFKAAMLKIAKKAILNIFKFSAISLRSGLNSDKF
ncbi:hypothetical protein [Campylobacter rectus]|uniref:Uncharacterized protein n=1 Tax=Campylobacter rectus TaxID=203 RepID=A0A6G5QMP8_CAMRE|nr:hypothetical protein [Campylobacter rectus]QCD46864.1 hypothetical protein CRECT_1205 [Campylobacter rectus]UEB47565.1 hypothetical protein LK437_11310 [Campylobacter rectus]